ncbi:glycosyltransferase [Tautonia sociabilis]|uniref:Glycosyltransferase n=1 Tax=Tautonia sociabilis TaxID=2080755 RepID=A0A432MFF6_9BACT|nr:glycosyltransferase [Tautonia sociabilis]RUL84900.1 glycosyltransferase [Tautonia sociabilis]
MTLVRSPRPVAATPTEGSRLSLVVADANWYSTENLFRELDRPGVHTLLLHCSDFANAYHAGGPIGRWWDRRPRRDGPGLWSRRLVLPPGWMKRYPRLGMRPIRRAIDRWRLRLGDDAPLALVMTYPYYRHLRDLLRPDVSIYLNLDDYTHYWPSRAAEVERLERRLVAEADLTACVAKVRADQLREQVPEASARIRHLPHGTPAVFLADSPSGEPAPAPADLAHLPRPLLGYVGGLEGRLDWPLLNRVAEQFPDASLVLVGRLPRSGRGRWLDDARRCLARPNVHAVGFRPQERLGCYIRSFDACLIPYDVTHPFNRCCCPTKIMDYMGSGRPIVSTDLPECRLYDGLIDVAADLDDFLGTLASLRFARFDDGRGRDRLALARANSCRAVSDRLLDAVAPALAAPDADPPA